MVWHDYGRNDEDNTFHFADYDRTENNHKYFKQTIYTASGLFKYHPFKNLELGAMAGVNTNNGDSWAKDMLVDKSIVANTQSGFHSVPNFQLSVRH